jgi:hypothetical protein
MRLKIAAAVAALTFAAPLSAQSAIPDLSEATPVAGRWTWTATADGSEAAFLDTAGRAQLWLRCSRTAQTFSLARPSSSIAPFLAVWTTAQTRSLPASYNPATARVTAQISASDPLLDALAFSRGRIAVGISGSPLLVTPAWPEIARVVEDCRS